MKDLSEYLSEQHSEHGERRKVGNAGSARYSVRSTILLPEAALRGKLRWYHGLYSSSEHKRSGGVFIYPEQGRKRNVNYRISGEKRKALQK